MSRGFQRWAARFPLTRRIARRDGEAIFDLVAGFVHSQVLHALVKLGVLRLLAHGEMPADALSRKIGLAPERARALLRAGVALGLLKQRRGGTFGLTRKGAAIPGVPGLEAMILHHGAFFRDMGDPVNVLRGGKTELAEFWPYVFGAGAVDDPDTAARYSRLMADSQILVAEETLACLSLKGVRHIMDVGGGTGAFLAAVLRHEPGLEGTLLDLPQVVSGAPPRFRAEGLLNRVTIHPASFRDDPLPKGADAISLVRVLYDHDDDTVRALLSAIHGALPAGGRLIVSEPMTGGDAPTRAGDVYFAFYTMAMGTGRARSAGEISALLEQAGYADVRHVSTHRPFVTSVVEARKPDK